jgi:hypothetical protein
MWTSVSPCVKATRGGAAVEWIFDTRFAEWSNAVTETYALVNFQLEEEEAAENQTLSKPDNQTGVIKLDNSTSSKAEEAGANELANIMATLSHGEESKCTSDGQYLAGTMSIQVSLPPLPEKIKALAASTLVTTAAAANNTAVNYSAAVHAFGVDTSLTLASTAVTGARRCGSDIRHLGRYSLTMPVTGKARHHPPPFGVNDHKVLRKHGKNDQTTWMMPGLTDRADEHPHQR